MTIGCSAAFDATGPTITITSFFCCNVPVVHIRCKRHSTLNLIYVAQMNLSEFNFLDEGKYRDYAQSILIILLVFVEAIVCAVLTQRGKKTFLLALVCHSLTP